MAKPSIDELQQWSFDALGHRFANPSLLIEALTHSSAAGRGRQASCQRSNERLEFLGDRVLGLAVADLLIDGFPDEAEGALTHRHDAMVRRETLASVAVELELDRRLQLGGGQDGGLGGGRSNPAILADACEAVLGALYLDAGYDITRGFIQRHWMARLERMAKPPRDAKTELQEWVQARGLPLPTYAVTDRSGPAHQPTFTIRVEVEGGSTAVGMGLSKRVAEQEAAERLLAELPELTGGQHGG